VYDVCVPLLLISSSSGVQWYCASTLHARAPSFQTVLAVYHCTVVLLSYIRHYASPQHMYSTQICDAALLYMQDPYLRASGAAAGDSTVAAAQSSQAALEGGPRRMSAKGSAGSGSSTKSSGERELQMRILRFLGGLGGKSHHLVVDASEVSASVFDDAHAQNAL
jgi:hypothetical protein